jgi:hypothetical protein
MSSPGSRIVSLIGINSLHPIVKKFSNKTFDVTWQVL